MRGVRRTAREVSQLGQLLFAKMTDTESACCYHGFGFVHPKACRAIPSSPLMRGCRSNLR